MTDDQIIFDDFNDDLLDEFEESFGDFVEENIEEKIAKTPLQSLEMAFEYARDVVSGRFKSSRDVIIQCKRFLRDYERNQHQKGYRWYFDEERARDVIEFSTLCHFTSGDPTGLPLKLAPWHTFVLANVYGWRRKSNSEEPRYRHIYCLVGRKNSKTLLMSVIAMYELLFGAKSTQMVIAATQMKQAKLLFDDVDKMRQLLPKQFSNKLHKVTNYMENKDTWSDLAPLSRETDSLEGKRPIKAFFDECAKIRENEVFETILTGQGSFIGRQAFYITTGQVGAMQRPFYTLIERARDVVRGNVKDERSFALLYTLDEGDDWEDSSNWIKANPSWGGSIQEEELQDAYNQLRTEEQKASFRARRLNLFEDSAQSWLSSSDWLANRVEEKDFRRDLPLTMGLDLGSTDDLASVTSIYGPDTDGTFYFETKCWIPQQAYDQEHKTTKGLYMEAVKDGVLHVTDTRTVDQRQIEEYILETYKAASDFQNFCYDRTYAGNLIYNLIEEGVPVEEVKQMPTVMGPASFLFETAVLDGKMKHIGVPFLTWQIGCAERKEYQSDLFAVVKPRNKRERKIDSLIAGIIAMSFAHSVEPKSTFSWYIPE